MRLNCGQLDELIRVYSLKAARPKGNVYSLELARETKAALEELRSRRAKTEIAVEGTVR
jgi:hypothetical protein